jgi:hypothetical protein
MVVGLSVMLPVSAAHVVPLIMADECPSPLKSRDTPKKYGGCGTANATPKYGDIALDLPIQSSLQVRNLGIKNSRRGMNGLDSIVWLINPFLHENSELSHRIMTSAVEVHFPWTVKKIEERKVKAICSKVAILSQLQRPISGMIRIWLETIKK